MFLCYYIITINLICLCKDCLCSFACICSKFVEYFVSLNLVFYCFRCFFLVFITLYFLNKKFSLKSSRQTSLYFLLLAFKSFYYCYAISTFAVAISSITDFLQYFDSTSCFFLYSTIINHFAPALSQLLFLMQ